jgi:outer membrane receptor protein involved in Fe transport
MRLAKWMSGAAVGGIIAGLGVSTPAWSQDEEERDEIIVSARKTEETLQEAPIAVTALTAEDIRKKGLRNIDDVARFSPGLSFSQAFGRSTDRPVIRGQSNVLANVQFGVESGTAVFVDGIYYPTTIQSLDFNLVKQVEVIRGPQSALYGRNTYAGAINFITLDPSMDDHSVKVRGRAANGGEKQISGSASGPIIGDMLSALVSGSYYEYDGQWTNELTGLKVGQEESWNVTGIVSFTPFDSLKAKARVTYQQDNDGPLPLFLQGSAENNCFPGFRSNFYRGGGTLSGTPGALNNNQYFCGIIEPDVIRLNTQNIAGPPFRADGTAFDGIERELLVTGLNVDWEVADGLTIASQTGYRTETERFGTDSDHSDANIFTGPTATTEPLFANTNVNDIRDYSQEIRIDWEAFERLRLMVGGFFYFQEDKGRDITKTSGEAGIPYGQPSLGAGVGIDPGCSAANSNCSNRATVENWAVFGLAEFNLTDTVSITGEIRYMEETKGLKEYSGAGVLTFNGVNTEDYITPRVTLDWQATDDHLLYFVYAEGVKPGGFNGTLGVPTGQSTYLPETADSFEIGLKSEWFDSKVTTNIAAYMTNSSQVQLTTALPPPPGVAAVTSIVTNQGEGKTYGVEAELFWTPTDNFEFGLNYAWTRPEFTEGCDQDQWIFTSGGGVFRGTPAASTSFNGVFGGVASCDISGKKFPFTSEHMGSASAQYTRPVAGDMEFFVGGNASYESSKFVQVHNTAETGYAFLLGAQLGIRGDNWSANIFGRNITNEDSIILATRWFDLRYGSTAVAPAPARIAASGGTATQGLPNSITTGSPRGLFGTLRRPVQFGIEFSYEF